MEIQIGAPIVYVSFSAEIDVKTTESLIAIMSNCVNLKVKTVYLLISTPGGFVTNGLNLYNILKGMPFELTTHNVGNVDSIGNIVFLAGSKRYATSASTFMFHGVGFNIDQKQRFEEKDLRERLDGVLSDQKRIGDIISQHTDLTEKDVAELFLQAHTKDANFAVEKGIIHEIREVQIPTDVPVISLVFQRQSV